MLKKFSLKLLAALYAAHTIVSLSQPFAFKELIRLHGYLAAMAISLVIALIIVESVYRLNKSLDKSIPWKPDTVHRAAYQLLLCFVLPLVVVTCLSALYFMVYGLHVSDTAYFDLYFPVLMQMIFMLNCVLTIDTLFIEGEIVPPEGMYPVTDIPSSVNNELQLKMDFESDILLAACVNGIHKLWRSPEDYEFYFSSLKFIAASVNSKKYLHINTAFLVRLDNIESIKPTEAGQYILVPKIPVGFQFTISRRQAIKLEGLI